MISAFEREWNQCARYFRTRAGSLARNREDAEDLFGLTRLKAFSSFAQWEPQRQDFQGWAYRILINTHLDAVRAAGRRIQPILGMHLEYIPYDLPGNEDLITTLNMLSKLPKKDRTALLLNSSGYSHRETARQLGVSHQAARSRICRARQKMRKLFATPAYN